MTINFETRMKRALENKDHLKGAECCDDTTLGRYIDGELSAGERVKVEEHASQCFFCLDRLAELKGLLYFEKKSNPVSADILKKVEALVPAKKKSKRGPSFGINDLFSAIGRFLLFPMQQWRYVAVGIMSACIAVVIASTIAGPERGAQKLPQLNPDAFAQVRALDAGGRVLNESQGLIIGEGGIVASDLAAVVGASSVEISLRNGKSLSIKQLWKDDGRNLALLKVEGETLPYFPVADIKQMSVGQKAFVVADPLKTKKVSAEAVISDFKSYSGRKGTGDTQYIQLATFTAQYTRGAIVDAEGRLMGIVVTGEKHLNLAVPLEGAAMRAKGQNPISVSELKDIKVSPEALNFYFKGILARDAKTPDEAIQYFKKAIELNPNLEAAHLELGFLYYRKRLFDLERKAYEEALRINPYNTDTLFYLATNMETAGQYEEAVKVFEKIAGLDPEDADARYELGLAYLARGEKARALKVSAELKNLDPGLAEKLKRVIDGKR